MDAPRRLEATDPDFDASNIAPSRLRDFDPAEHQRLVVNPFLAVLGLILLIRASLGLFASSIPTLAIATIVPLTLTYHLIHYHCLDCGRTGLYPRHRGHACPAVLSRWRGRGRSRVPFWTPRVQLIAWGWILGTVAMVLAVLRSPWSY